MACQGGRAAPCLRDARLAARPRARSAATRMYGNRRPWERSAPARLALTLMRSSADCGTRRCSRLRSGCTDGTGATGVAGVSRAEGLSAGSVNTPRPSLRRLASSPPMLKRPHGQCLRGAFFRSVAAATESRSTTSEETAYGHGRAPRLVARSTVPGPALRPDAASDRTSRRPPAVVAREGAAAGWHSFAVNESRDLCGQSARAAHQQPTPSGRR